MAEGQPLNLNGLIQATEQLRSGGEQQSALGAINAILPELGTVTVFAAQAGDPNVNAYMKLARIVVNSAIGAAKTTTTWTDAMPYIAIARRVILDVYGNPDVANVAQRMTKDAGTEYQMRIEMFRDEATYWQFLAGVTGNAAYLQRAVNVLDAAILIAEDGSSAKGLSLMEGHVLRRQLAEARPDAIINNPREELREGYACVMANPAGGSDRKRAASYTYAKTAFAEGNYGKALRGARNFLIWDRRYQRETGKSIWETASYIARKRANTRREVMRRDSYRETPDSVTQFEL